MMFVEFEGNLLLVEPDAQVAEAIDDARLWLTAATTLAIVAVIALRWRAASRPRRKALLPGVMGIVSGLLYVVQLLVVLLAEAPFPELPFWLTSFALLLVPAAYLFGLLRSRLARGGLAELFLGLGTMRGEELRAALGRALGDPSLEVVHGRAEPADGRSVAPIERGGEQVALVYDSSLDDDPELVDAVSAAAAIALENERLHEESQAQPARRRAAAARGGRPAAQADPEPDPARSGDGRAARGRRGRRAGAVARGAARARARDPPRGARQGPRTALQSLAARSPVPAGVSYEAPERLPQPVELAAYFVASEALANVAKYARATAVDVRVRARGARLQIAIADDGVGGASPRDGSGLRELADRVEALGGRLDVVSPPGAGTVVTAELPWRSA